VARRLARLQQHAVERGDLAGTGRIRLTSREAEVLQLIAEGKANKETAALLGISIKTVEKHRGSLMSKLDIHDTAGLTRYAISAGVVESSVQVTIL
jgi:DNA-binding NarL/FixJ family response regulator